MSRRISFVIPAYTRVEYSGVVEVPEDASDEQIAQALYDLQKHADGGEYVSDNDYWENGEPHYEDVSDEDVKPDHRSESSDGSLSIRQG